MYASAAGPDDLELWHMTLTTFPILASGMPNLNEIAPVNNYHIRKNVKWQTDGQPERQPKNTLPLSMPQV